MKVRIVSTGSFLPAKLLRNDELGGQFPVSALPLIEKKTGILSRRHAEKNEPTSALAVQAALMCLKKSGLPAEKVDALVLATSTPDRLLPATATKVAHAVGAHRAFAFDMNSVCSGSVFLLEIARSLIAGGSATNVLVVAADTYSKFLNPADFSTYPYFGDGAALLSSEDDREGLELLGSVLHSDGRGYDTISIKAGGSELPIASSTEQTDRFFRMNGRDVFDFATTKAPEIIKEALERFGIAKENVDSFILHQANINILERVATSLGVSPLRFFSNLQTIGNTAGASVLIALDEYLDRPAPKREGAYVVAVAFGGGLSWGASVLKLQMSLTGG